VPPFFVFGLLLIPAIGKSVQILLALLAAEGAIALPGFKKRPNEGIVGSLQEQKVSETKYFFIIFYSSLLQKPLPPGHLHKIKIYIYCFSYDFNGFPRSEANFKVKKQKKSHI
jgi:hypothetical protein